jgi:hypothetical protein
MVQYNNRTEYNYKQGDFILVVRTRPKFWQSKIHSFGIYNDNNLAVIKKGKLTHVPIPEKHSKLIQELPKNRGELAKIYLSDNWIDTLELANMVHGTKHTCPMEFLTVYQIPRDGNLEFYV